MALTLNRLLKTGAFAASALLATVAAASAQGARAGVLQCNVSGGTGFIITSSKALDCFFERDGGGQPEHYFGTVNRFGIDFGFTGPGKLGWVVLATGAYPGPGSLQGVYSGVGGGATVGVGVGANVLVGGNGGSLSLQPVSVSEQLGLNVTAGVGQMTLDYAPLPPPDAPARHRR